MTGEEARRQLHKNAASNLEHVLAATPHKTPTVRLLPPITKTIQVRQTRHAGHCWRSWTNSYMMYSYGLPHMAEQKQDDQNEHPFSNYVGIRDVVQKTCQRRWTIKKSSERGPEISLLPARHDDDDDISQTKQTRRTLLEKQGRAYKWSSPMDPFTWPSKSRATGSNVHTAALWGYRM